MNGKKILITAMSAALLLSGAAAAFAAPGHHMGGPHGRHGPGIPPEILFVRMLQQFDTNKDGQISKDEAKNGMETIFAAIDTNNDGSLTPGEIRKYHEAQMAKAKAPADDMAADDDAAPAPPPADADAGQPAPPQDEANRGPGRHGMRGPGMIRELMIMQRIDTDENGQISKQEAEAAFDKFFTRMDTNKDGVISIADMPQRPFL